jgi:hypothetical protein
MKNLHGWHVCYIGNADDRPFFYLENNVDYEHRHELDIKQGAVQDTAYIMKIIPAKTWGDQDVPAQQQKDNRGLQNQDCQGQCNGLVPAALVPEVPTFASSDHLQAGEWTNAQIAGKICPATVVVN